MKIAADFGITVTDLLRKDKDGNLFHNMQLSSGEVSPEYLKQLFKDLDLNKEVELIAVTGGRHLSIGEEVEGVSVIHVNEIDAIGEGAMHLSGVDPAKPTIIISAGSGTACIFAKDNKFMHCSGTGVGGGTVLGLSKLLIGTSDPLEIEKLATKGDESSVDLIIEDVVLGPIGQLPPETTAVNFGKVANSQNYPSKEDIAAGIINLVGQTAARIATSVAMAFQAEDIVVVGRSPSFIGLKKSLEEAALLTGFKPIFPKNGEYASALGALIIADK
ncbi:MAG TPA: Fumble domain-containing protein [SAR86 cluster bacterium]|jgi:type II pantothenate kinase|nr:Fumble domain-containing protein [SAR86 cluster bacterium]|tara:strand:- start:113 stop:934 length:822 start_codon:yes stop_codon:yes gene_type:complete